MKKFYLFLINFLVVTNSFALVWETEKNDFWSQSITWKDGIVPSYVCSDTILINPTLSCYKFRVIFHDLPLVSRDFRNKSMYYFLFGAYYQNSGIY